MKNLILKKGDLIKIISISYGLRLVGLRVGQYLEVKSYTRHNPNYETPKEILCLNGPDGNVELTTIDNELTENAECIKLVKCPVVLSKGISL